MNVGELPPPTFGEWLQEQLDNRGWSRPRLARMIEYSPGAIAAWIRGDRIPEERACDAIAAALGVDHNEVRRLAGRPETVSGTAHGSITFNAQATGQVRPGVEVGARVNVVVEPTLEPVEVAYVPILGTAAADALRANWGSGDMYPILRSELHGLGRARLLVVSGRCMEPVINHGDLVLVDVEAEPKIGNVVAVRVGDEVTLKEYWSDDGREIILRPRDPSYDAIRIPKSDQGAALVGVVRRRYPASIPI